MKCTILNIQSLTYHAICRFDVPMDNSHGMYVLQSQHQLCKPQHQLSNVQFIALNHLLEIPTSNVAHHQVQAVVVAERVLEVDHVAVLHHLQNAALTFNHLGDLRLLLELNSFDCIRHTSVLLSQQMH